MLACSLLRWIAFQCWRITSHLALRVTLLYARYYMHPLISTLLCANLFTPFLWKLFKTLVSSGGQGILVWFITSYVNEKKGSLSIISIMVPMLFILLFYEFCSINTHCQQESETFNCNTKHSHKIWHFSCERDF